MANPQNLILERSTDEAREMGKKGGIASGRARRKKADFRKLLEAALSMRHDVNGQEMTVAEGMTIAIIERALSGDCKAWELVRDTMGQKPVEKKETAISGGLNISWGSKEE